MSIKIRFLILYLAMIIVPITFLFWVTPLIGNLSIGNFSSFKLPVNFVSFSFGMSVQPSVDERELTNFILSNKPLRNFDILSDQRFFTGIEKKLNVGFLKTGFIIEKNHKVIYISPFLKASRWRTTFSEIKRTNGEKDGKFTPLGKTGYRFSRYNFHFRNGTPGCMYVLYNDNLFKKALGNVFFGLLATFITVFILVNIAITFYISRSIIKPLGRLEDAAVQIREGNLNFKIPQTTRGEIGRLNAAFEEMRRKLQESLEKQLRYENNRKELISGISHDLRTPIAAVKGYIEGIRDGVANSPEKEAKYIEIIYRKATEVEELINKLFLYSKLDLKQMPFNFDRVPIVRFLRDYLDDLQFDLAEKGIKIVFAPEISVETTVVADQKELIRVINNLIANSVKFMNETDSISKAITVELKEENGDILVEVRDNGPGIDNRDLPYIFERFYQADSPEGGSGEGSGLGLAIAKMIIEGHGGRIWAESRYGDGTSIFFTLKKDLHDKKGECL